MTLQERLGTTTLYVTHDQVEAMTMGDRIAIMSHGVLQQVATPQALYADPANTFVARFLGSPGMNLVPGTIDQDRDGPGVTVSGGRLAVPPALVPVATAGRTVTAGLRPEHLRVDPEGSLQATVTIVEVLGAEVHVICHLADGTRLVVRQDAGAGRPALGSAVRVAATEGTLALFDDEGSRLVPA